MKRSEETIHVFKDKNGNIVMRPPNLGYRDPNEVYVLTEITMGDLYTIARVFEAVGVELELFIFN